MKRRNFLGLGFAALFPCSFLFRKKEPYVFLWREGQESIGKLHWAATHVPVNLKAADFDSEMIAVTDLLSYQLNALLKSAKDQNIALEDIKIVWRNIPTSDKTYPPTFLRTMIRGYR